LYRIYKDFLGIAMVGVTLVSVMDYFFVFILSQEKTIESVEAPMHMPIDFKKTSPYSFSL